MNIERIFRWTLFIPAGIIARHFFINICTNLLFAESWLDYIVTKTRNGHFFAQHSINSIFISFIVFGFICLAIDFAVAHLTAPPGGSKRNALVVVIWVFFNDLSSSDSHNIVLLYSLAGSSFFGLIFWSCLTLWEKYRQSNANQ